MTDPVTKVLMLDFDNVLNDNAHILATAKEFPGIQTYNPDMGRAMLDPVRCARIQRVCDATGAAILLVTGWRKWAKWEDLAVGPGGPRHHRQGGRCGGGGQDVG